MSVSIQFLGAVDTVTGSQFLVTSDRARVLVDCGLFQGSPEEIERNHLPFAYEPDSVDALVLTHAHLDHCGRTPALVKLGFRGPIHATRATVDLTEIVLRDSARLQVEFTERWNRRHAGEGASEELAEETDDESLPERLRSSPPEGRTETRRPLYDEGDVEQTMGQMRGCDYGDEVEIANGMTAVLHDAGHILGSAIVELRVTDGEGDRTIVFSGDLGRDGSPIIRDPRRLSHADAIVVESTYGNREHADHEAGIEELVAAIREVSDDEGVLLVPAFAIGRTQEVIWVLDELVREKRIPRVPLYLDSPMASRATSVYHDHPEIYDAETKERIASGESPLEYPGQQFTDSVEESKAIRRAKRPIMVVASSGMLTGGRIMHHLKDFLPDPTCTLLFIGYQGQGTLGRHIQNGGTSARIDGEEIPVRCRVRSVSAFSAHADQHELEAWLRNFGDPNGEGEPKRVFIVHGDPDASEAFADRVRTELGMEPYLPKHRERVTLS